jgi:5-methylcytosine-specific restriction protein A
MKSENLVTSIGQVRDNVLAMVGFGQGTAAEVEFHRGRIKNGKNFVALKSRENYVFAPSKFTGYANNGLDHMDKLDDRDGGVTNRRLSELIGEPISPGSPGYLEVDREYEAYCSAHQIRPSRHKRARRYWVIG